MAKRPTVALMLFVASVHCGGQERAHVAALPATAAVPAPSAAPPEEPAPDAPPPTPTPTPSAPAVPDYVAQGGSCGRVTATAFGRRPVGVLSGRFALRFLQGATSGPPSWDVMSAPQPAAEATRVWLMVGGRPHVAMTFEEKFALAGPSLQDAVAAYARSRGLDVRFARISTADPGLQVIGLVPNHCALNEENAAVVLEAVIADGAGMITTVVVGVDASELGDCGACTDRVVEALGTLTGGARAFGDAPGERALTGSRGWQVTVPQGWSLISQPGPDFVWHRIRKPAVFPNPPAIVAFYDGDPPDSELPPGARETARTRATIAGRAGEWRLWTRPLPNLTVYGGFVSPRPPLPFVVHVLATAEADRDAGTAIVASLRQSGP